MLLISPHITDWSDCHFQPLHIPVHVLSFYQAVEELVKSGADINERSSDGMTPLGIAAFWGYAELAEFLLKSG